MPYRAKLMNSRYTANNTNNTFTKHSISVTEPSEGVENCHASSFINLLLFLTAFRFCNNPLDQTLPLPPPNTAAITMAAYDVPQLTSELSLLSSTPPRPDSDFGLPKPAAEEADNSDKYTTNKDEDAEDEQALSGDKEDPNEDKDADPDKEIDHGQEEEEEEEMLDVVPRGPRRTRPEKFVDIMSKLRQSKMGFIDLL